MSNENNFDDLMDDALTTTPVIVDTRAESKAPTDPWEKLSETSRQESQAASERLMPLMRPSNFRMTAPEKRDEVCALVMWKLNTTMFANWKEPAEARYQADLKVAREYWQRYVTPDETASAEKISANMKRLWIATPGQPGRVWPQQTLSRTLQELGI
jgi:hypothetical protein